MSAPPYNLHNLANHAIAPGGSGVNLNEEVHLYDSTKQRELFESLAEIYSIITALDFLEKAFVRDSVSHEEYTSVCLRLIGQYNTILKNEDVAREFGSLDEFRAKYSVDYPSAISRLKIAVPATVEHSVTMPTPSSSASMANLASGTVGGTGRAGGASARAVAEATGNFITCMDGLRLNYKAKDQLHPLLSELIQSLNKIPSLVQNSNDTSEFNRYRAKLVQWLIKLNGMRVNDELQEEDTRQLLFDLDMAYKEFYTMLE